MEILNFRLADNTLICKSATSKNVKDIMSNPFTNPITNRLFMILSARYFLLTLLLNTVIIYSQDSIIYSQKTAVMFSNEYVFFNNGRFKHYYKTDDGQIWYGTGTFIDKGRKRILKFEDPDLNYKIEFGKLHHESNFKRILIRRGNKYKSQDYYYTTRKKYVYFTN